jgi:DNA invertase Pin-like site-specific DNA recombinase
MKPVAYSYIRFSSEPQAWGDSRRRQTAAATRYARQNDLALDDGLTFQDLGVSAFRGRNSRTGALGAFLAAIELGVIAPGSYLRFRQRSRQVAISEMGSPWHDSCWVREQGG